MAEKCPVCGEKIGGIFSEGALKPSSLRLDFCQKNGIRVEEGICQKCLEIKIDQFTKEKKTSGNFFLQENIQDFEQALSTTFVTPSPIPPGFQDLGLVTGYCIMGTGPISAIASSFTDFFGEKSNAYLEKVKLAETDALNMLKVEALKKRADAVYNVRVNLAEATSGHGMIMVSVSGAAVNSGKADNDIEEAWRMVAEGK